MADSKEVIEISKALQAVLVEIKNAAKTMNKAAEKLSTTGIDKLTSEVTKSLEQRKLLNSAEAKAIANTKNAKERTAKLASALEVLEKQLIAVQKIEEEEEARKIKDLKTTGAITKGQIENQKRIEQASKEVIAARLAELNISTEHAQLLKDQLPLLRQEAEAKARAIAAVDGVNKIHDSLRATIVDQIKSFGTWQNAMNHLTKAVSLTYEMANRLSGQGMIGAMETFMVLSPKLMMSAKDLEEVMNKNRDLVNQMGGGIVGVNKFADEIYKAKDQLEYLGKDWGKAGANFVELAKHSGLTPKDGKAYQKNFRESIESFKDFSAMFGDTPESFKALQEGMMEDETIRQRLNGLNKTQLGQELEEQRQRAYNLKLMGLSNEQIVDFNKKLANVIDPRKSGDLGERAKQAEMFRQTFSQDIQLLMQSGTKENQELAAEMQSQTDAIAKIANVYSTGNAAQFQKAVEDNPKAAKLWARGQAAVDQMDRRLTESRNITGEMSQKVGSAVEEIGRGLNTAQAQGKDVTDKLTNPLGVSGLEKNNRDKLLAENGPEAKILAVSAGAYERLRLLIEGPFGEAITAAAAGLTALALAAGTKGLLGVFKSLIGIGTGASAAAAEAAAGAAGVGGAAAAGGTSATLGKLATLGKAGVGVGLLMHSGDAGMSDKEEQSELIKRQRNGFVPYNGSNSPGASGSQQPGIVTPNQEVTGGVDPRKKKLLDFISKYESSGSYNKLVGGKEIDLQNMTISEVMAYQDKMIASGSASTAVGRYQVIKKTLMGAVKDLGMDPTTTKFSQSTQDKIGEYLLNKRGADSYLNGSMSQAQFATNLSKEWAALPANASGRGYYDNFNGNKSGVSYAGMTGALTAMNSVPGIGTTSSSMNAPGVSTMVAATPTPSSAAVVASTSAAGSTTVSPIEELKKQTSILTVIAQNTATKSSISVNQMGYKQDTSLVMGGIAG